MTDVLLCVGNSMMGDDGAGPLLAEKCAAAPKGNWVVIDGGSAPENDIVAIRELRPTRLLIVDATDMGLNPGEIRIIDPDDIAVIQDDMDMPVGQLRIRRKGSAGGHNGIKSITEHLGTDAYPRFKIGIGHPARNNKAVVNHVLHAFQGEDKTAIEAAVAEMATALEEWIKSGDIEEVMQAHNKKKPKAEKPAAE